MSVLKTYDGQTGHHPSLTYRVRDGRIEGMADGIEAVRQSIGLTLSTERYAWPVFSSDYGVELSDLIGKRRAYVEADLERRITEALLQDDRITGVRDFSAAFDRENVWITLTADTVFGEIREERGMPVGGI